MSCFPVIPRRLLSQSTVDPTVDLLVIAVSEPFENVRVYEQKQATVQRESVSEPRNCRQSFAAIFASFLIAALLGCSSGAQREIYQQKMAGEIRVLEDQLYEADYHNRVLSDELERCRIRTETARSASEASTSKEERNHSAIAPKSSVTEPIPDPIANPDRDTSESGQIQMDSGFDSEDLELPAFDTGEPVDPDALTDPIPVPDPDQQESDSSPQELPAPGLPQPPGKEDLTVPQIDPGEILPPPAGGREEESDQPGKIELPDSVSKPSGVPEEIKIHTGLTTGITGDGESNEMTIMLFVVDNLGRPVNLDDFEIDANLSIVLLDPDREASKARIGRWDFTSDQISTFVRHEPISGLQVPISWYGDRPSGKQVVIHARLRAEEDEMRCERKLDVNKKESIAEWTPRGEDVRR